MLAFRSLDPFRALREPDRRRRDEERLSRSEQRTLSKTQNNHLTGKAPYKFEPISLQRGVGCELRSGGYGIARRRPSRKVGVSRTGPSAPRAHHHHRVDVRRRPPLPTARCASIATG